METRKHKYDIAISYANEQKSYVKKLAEALLNHHMRIFADFLEPNRFWGEDLPTELRKIYHDECKYILIILSKEYAQKGFSQFEGKVASERHITGDKFFVIKYDDVTLPWLNTSIGYIDSSAYNETELAALLVDKIKKKR